MHSETRGLAGGTLHLFELEKRGDKAGRWREESSLRVWTPPGYDAERPPEGGYGVLYVADAQNVFEDWTAHQGVSWRAADAVSGLMAAGQLRPIVLVGIDGAGANRSWNYLPWPPGTGAGGFRGDCARWPGGGVDAYVDRVITEYMPFVERRFAMCGPSPCSHNHGARSRAASPRPATTDHSPLRARARSSTDRGRRAFGGASFGGIAALHIARKAPHVFGGLLCESPSLWVGEGRYLQDLWEHTGPLPERVFLAAGTREYSATRDHERLDVDELLLHYAREAARALEERGGLRDGRLRFQVDEGAGHHESAWAWRLPGALQFLFGHLAHPY